MADNWTDAQGQSTSTDPHGQHYKHLMEYPKTRYFFSNYFYLQGGPHCLLSVTSDSHWFFRPRQLKGTYFSHRFFLEIEIFCSSHFFDRVAFLFCATLILDGYRNSAILDDLHWISAENGFMQQAPGFSVIFCIINFTLSTFTHIVTYQTNLFVCSIDRFTQKYILITLLSNKKDNWPKPPYSKQKCPG